MATGPPQRGSYLADRDPDHLCPSPSVLRRGRGRQRRSAHGTQSVAREFSTVIVLHSRTANSPESTYSRLLQRPRVPPQDRMLCGTTSDLVAVQVTSRTDLVQDGLDRPSRCVEDVFASRQVTSVCSSDVLHSEDDDHVALLGFQSTQAAPPVTARILCFERQAMCRGSL